MQTLSANQPPFDAVLLQEETITVTSAYIEIEQTSYALKYLSTVSLSESHPPRAEALIALVICAIAVLALIVYLTLGKVSVNGFIVMVLLVLSGAAIAAAVLWLNPSNFVLDMTMINGENIQVRSQSEGYIHRVHKAVTAGIALNRQDTVVQNPPSLVSGSVPRY